MQPLSSEIIFIAGLVFGMVIAVILISIGYKAGRDQEGKPMLSLPVINKQEKPYHFTNEDEFSEALADDKKRIPTMGGES